VVRRARRGAAAVRVRAEPGLDLCARSSAAGQWSCCSRREHRARPSLADRDRSLDRDSAAAEMVRGHLEHRGPSTIADLMEATGLPSGDVTIAVARLEGEGFAFRGHFAARRRGGILRPRLLARIHTYTRAGCAGRSSRSPRATSCASCSAGSTSPRARGARGDSACSRSSSSSRASSWPPVHGSACWAAAWRSIGTSGSTTCARGDVRGAGSRSERRWRGAAAPERDDAFAGHPDHDDDPRGPVLAPPGDEG